VTSHTHTEVVIPEFDEIINGIKVMEWSAEEEAILHKYYRDFAERRQVKKLAAGLGRSHTSVRLKAGHLGLTGRRED
jgi:transcriptional regulator of aromatic amino acid metabolism